ncbi:MaoC family dehydratase [Sporichthya polymorpha]|uniref:MaoC family dehydratase n=1 Tax=Sporichthya polymorpha TaxID=35751 RepID=UPI0003A18435|nr:MaoC family dehydratase [Sporichthya polymorpha]
MNTDPPGRLILDRPQELLDHIGFGLGPSSWYTVEQSAVDAFADATADRQWIHVDPERAAKGPFGTTIAHGYMSVGLITPLFSEVLVVHDQSMIVNYGMERVRFPAPVLLPARVRLTGTIAHAEPVARGIHLASDVILELEGSAKPACVARVLYRYLT